VSDRMTRLTTVLSLAVVAALGLSGCTATPKDDAPEVSTAGASGDPVFGDAEVAKLVTALPERTVKALPAARLADGLTKPTNTWFAGLVFGEESMPVFPLPLSFQLTKTGFALGLPTVTTTAANIAGGFVDAVHPDLGADDQVVTAYDAASVTITQYKDKAKLGRTVIAEGSPFVSFTAETSVDIGLGKGFTAGSADGYWTTKVGGVTYGLVSAGSVDGSTLSLDEGQAATWFALPDDAKASGYVEAARHPVTGTTLTYDVSDTVATTSIGYTTADGSPTLVAVLPHQSGGLSDCDPSAGLGGFESIYGALTVCSGTQLTWGVPLVKADGTIDLSGITPEHKAQLVEQVTADASSMPDFPSDTYFGGKALARAANLWSVATQVGAEEAAAQVKEIAVKEMDQWMEPGGCDERATRCFVYDAEAGGVVGLDASFGSDEFNDHHFHYGYFLYAAGLFTADDPELAKSWAPVMNLLAADIATYKPGSEDDSTYFPSLRVFDAYAGHSWASGSSPFADGNNQESNSEAVNAWNGLALWAAASKQPALATEATWLLSSEAASASAYWTNFDASDPVYDGFEHEMISLNWGGKRDWATWFSAEPSAMLGITVLPVTAVSEYLAADPKRIRANLSEAAPKGFDVLFGDYLLMYSAMAGPEDATSALDAAGSLNEDRIDDGNSRSYLLAWLMAHADA
jgi:endo-1,3(4)-beta-glucanase